MKKEEIEEFKKYPEIYNYLNSILEINEALDVLSEKLNLFKKNSFSLLDKSQQDSLKVEHPEIFNEL